MRLMSTDPAQLRLLTWFSPAFPTGAFGYSHGLETAIREGRVADAVELRDWIEGLVEQGSGWADAVLFRAAWAAGPGDLADVAELAVALTPSRERRQETLGLGAAFLAALEPWRNRPMLPPRGSCREATEGVPAAAFEASTPSGLRPPPPVGEERVPYPVVAGEACGAAGIPLEPALTAFLHGFAANLVSAAIRAVPLGQGDGVAVMAALEPVILETAERAAASTLDDLGGCAFLSDIAALRHETLQPRLFVS
jgi:urease accessory protein